MTYQQGFTPAPPRPGAARRRRRAWLLWGPSPIWLGLLVIGLVLVIKTVAMSNAVVQYGDGDDDRAARGFRSALGLNVIERWKAPFAYGTTLSRSGDLERATRHLDDALEAVPEEHRCMVQINRAITFEALGDGEIAEADALFAEADRIDAGDASLGSAESLRAEARELAGWAEIDYRLALHARGDPTCSSPDRSEQEKEGDAQAEERVEQKKDDADSKADPETVEPDSEGLEGETERERQLRERNERAEAEAEALRQRDAGGRGGTQGW